jgi:hypothetical protein
MLTHIVCWKYKSEVTEEQRLEHIERLRSLPTIIPNIIDFKVGADVLNLERSFDTGLSSTFLDRAALEFYTEHSIHKEVAALGRELAEKIVSVDFID